MQSLLSPAESHAFQSFLSSIDYPLPDAAVSEGVTLSASEWALYNGSSAPGTGAYESADDSLMDGEQRDPEHREALAKATKDLMALDSQAHADDRGSGVLQNHAWDAGGVSTAMNVDHPMGHPARVFDANGNITSPYDQHHEQRMLVHQQQVLQHQAQHQAQAQAGQQQRQRQPSFSTAHDHFPFLHAKAQRSLPELTYPAHPMTQGAQQVQSQSHLPSLGAMNMNADPGHISPSSASPHSASFGYQQQQLNGLSLHHPQQLQLQQVHIPSQGESSRNGLMSTSRSTSAVPIASSSSSSSRPQIKVSTSTPNHLASSSSSSASPRLANGRSTRSAVNGVNSAGTSANTSTSSNTKRKSTSPSTPQSSHPPNQKQPLLSPSQKKANHIQSEQKRRANIRRGYEALCETVPALREAIRQEEEEAERIASAAGGGGRRKGKRKGGAGAAKDEDAAAEKDRLDGRAGPRSENVVLSKTIDHIQTLLADRSALLTRLHRARSALPLGHPALTPLTPDPPWEREWKGGEGKLGAGGNGEEGGSEGEEGEDD